MDYLVGHLKLQPHRQILDGREPVPIGRKALDLLSVLARAEGALVTKDELMAAVWPGVIVEENAIHVHMASVRRALGDAAEQLTTVRGLGYRLAANRVAAPSAFAPVARHPAKPLIAVLAFENRSNDPDLAYFADGVSEEILEAVARIDGVRVIARTSSFQIKGEDRRTSAVAAALGATHILDGSVRRDGDRLRIGAQLVEAAGETVVWSERFDGATGDVFALQDGIAQGVAAALSSKVRPRAPQTPVDPAAYDLYLQGRRISGPEQTKQQCVDLLEQAVTIAPDFADAWASIALARAISARWHSRTEPFAVQEVKARKAAERALMLDPTSGVAHVALSLLAPFAAYSEHEARFSQALALRPNDPEVIRQHGYLLWTVGRMAETYDCFARLWTLDPLSPTAVENYAAGLMEMGWAEQAFATYSLGRKRWPHIHWFYMEPMLYAAFDGNWRAVDALLAEEGADRPEAALARGTARALRNPDAEKKRKALVKVEATLAELGRVEPSQLIFLYGLGLHDEVFSLVEKSDFADRFADDGLPTDNIGFAPGIIFGVSNRPMRDDPRFVRLCEKLGLGAYWRETGRWPDCADEMPYDFRAAVMRAGEGA